MLKHLKNLFEHLTNSGLEKEANSVSLLFKKSQQVFDEYPEFASDVIGEPETRKETMSLPFQFGVVSFDLYQHPLASEIRAYCEAVANVFPLDESMRTGNVIPSAKEIDNIIDLATKYDNHLKLFGDWKDNPNLLDPVSFKKLVKYISGIVFQRSMFDIDKEEYIWATDHLVDIYTDFYTEEYLGSFHRPEGSEYSNKLDTWLEKNPDPDPRILEKLKDEGTPYVPNQPMKGFSEVKK